MTATPPFPEAALRAVLAQTVAAWARTVEESAEDEPRRLYVDGFAGAEHQFGSGVRRDPADQTRAAAAVRALDAGDDAPGARAAFVEEDPAHLQRVYQELEEIAGGERLRAIRDLASLAPGEVSLVEADLASAAADVVRASAGARPFFFLAPAAARSLPWSVLRPLAAVDGATLLVRLPHADFEKQSRHNSPLADLPGFVRRIVEGCSAMLDDPGHAWLPAWRSADGFGAAMEGVGERFHARLDTVAGGRLIRPMRLEAPDGAATWLFLVTPDPAVAMAATAAVRAAGVIDRAAAGLAPAAPASPTPIATEKTRARARRAEPEPPAAASPASGAGEGEGERIAETIEPQPNQRDDPPPPVAEVLDLFPGDVPPPEPATPARADAAAVAAAIEARFAARTVTWREVQAAFAACDVTPEELKKALALLRRGGRAAYRALKADDDAVEFPADPTAPARAPRRRKEPGGGFFGNGEG